MAIRTFIAVPLDEGIVQGLVKAQQCLETVGSQVRWVEPENLHLTLKFLGNVRDEEIPTICDIASQIASEMEPFDIAVEGLTSAPPTGQLRMVWARLHESTGRLQKMVDMMEDAYGSLGFKRENRQFHAHMTLGRVKSGVNIIQLREAVSGYAENEFGIQPVDEIVVFASELTGAGPIYSPLRRAPLGE